MDQKKMQGFEVPGDQKVLIPVRDWNALRLALWRSKGSWENAEHEAIAILDRCTHLDGCPSVDDETQPCLPERWEKSSQGAAESDEEFAARPAVRIQEGCPDREIRMSALVILNNARMYAPVDARRAAADPYMAPSREYFSEIIADLGACQIEILALREALRAAGVEAPVPVAHTPSMLTERAPPPQLSSENST